MKITLVTTSGGLVAGCLGSLEPVDENLGDL